MLIRYQRRSLEAADPPERVGWLLRRTTQRPRTRNVGGKDSGRLEGRRVREEHSAPTVKGRDTPFRGVQYVDGPRFCLQTTEPDPALSGRLTASATTAQRRDSRAGPASKTPAALVLPHAAAEPRGSLQFSGTASQALLDTGSANPLLDSIQSPPPTLPGDVAGVPQGAALVTASGQVSELRAPTRALLPLLLPSLPFSRRVFSYFPFPTFPPRGSPVSSFVVHRLFYFGSCRGN